MCREKNPSQANLPIRLIFQTPNEMKGKKRQVRETSRESEKRERERESNKNLIQTESHRCHYCVDVLCAVDTKIKSQLIATHRGIHFVSIKTAEEREKEANAYLSRRNQIY